MCGKKLRKLTQYPFNKAINQSMSQIIYAWHAAWAEAATDGDWKTASSGVSDMGQPSATLRSVACQTLISGDVQPTGK